MALNKKLGAHKVEIVMDRKRLADADIGVHVDDHVVVFDVPTCDIGVFNTSELDRLPIDEEIVSAMCEGFYRKLNAAFLSKFMR